MKQRRAIGTRRIRLWASACLFFAGLVQAAQAEAGARTFNLSATPKPVATVQIEDAQEKIGSLADLRGKTVLLNIWATWCVPCRKEMPSLDRLQAKISRDELVVLPLSIDRGGMDVIRKFYDEVGIKNLGMYRDATGMVTRTLGAVGIPTTLLIDRTGAERGRLIGPAEWDSPEMVRFIKCAIGEHETPGSAQQADTTMPGCRK